MSEANLVRVWQWLGLILVTVTTTIHSAVSGRTLGFWGAMPSDVRYEPATVYGIVIGAPLYSLMCLTAGYIAIDRRHLGRWQRLPDAFGLHIVPGRPLARLVPLAWMLLFVLLPTFSLGHFLRKFLKAYPVSCWRHWGNQECARLASSKGHAVDIVPGVQPYGMVILLLVASCALSFFLVHLWRTPPTAKLPTHSTGNAPPSVVPDA
jgi:hypothetical protein